MYLKLELATGGHGAEGDLSPEVALQSESPCKALAPVLAPLLSKALQAILREGSPCPMGPSPFTGCSYCGIDSGTCAHPKGPNGCPAWRNNA